MKRTAMFVLATGLAVALIAAPAQAQLPPQPSVNLGFTSFLDGGPPAGPGFYYQQYLQYYTADDLMGPTGKKAPGNTNLDAWVSLNQFIYQSDQPILLGGKWGIDVIVPVVSLDADFSPAPFGDDTGLGDLLVGPFIQWDPVMGDNGPIFMHRIELQNIFPTGDYDENTVFNPGSNHYSFNPYWAGTLFVTPQWTATTRIHYLWNDENDDPIVPFFPGASDTQAGDAIHINFATAYEVIPKKLRVGLNGYYFKQLSASELNGAGIPNSKAEVLGIGPGAVLHLSQDDHIFVNLYFETEAENTFEGTKLILRWTHHFSNGAE